MVFLLADAASTAANGSKASQIMKIVLEDKGESGLLGKMDLEKRNSC